MTLAKSKPAGAGVLQNASVSVQLVRTGANHLST